MKLSMQENIANIMKIIVISILFIFNYLSTGNFDNKIDSDI